MQKFVAWAALAGMFALSAACVTINVYFPEAAAEQAAQKFVDKVIGAPPATDTQPPPTEQQPPGKSPGAMLLDLLIPSAYAQQANLNIQTPQIQAIQTRMQQRFASTLSKYFANGVLGFTADGLVAVRDASKVPLAERAALNAAVANENRDRQAVYHEIAIANGHAEWETRIRRAFATQWIQRARPGWYYQDANGAWKQK